MSESSQIKQKFRTFKEWLSSDEPLIVAEGYLLEFERRGYLRAGDFIPTVVLEHPHLVKIMHEEFVHAGSDVTLAFTYYTHRKKMETLGMAESVEKINRTALSIAKEVAEKTGTFFAGGICNTNIMEDTEAAQAQIREMYEEQVRWAKEAGVEFIVAESLNSITEGKIALDVVKKAGLPIVITFNLYFASATTSDGASVADACKMMEDLGADVVGVNCGRGPQNIIPVLKDVRQKCKGCLAALPICYRTNEEETTWYMFVDPLKGGQMYPKDISARQVCPSDIEEFGNQCQEVGVRYVGLCCGNSGAFTRTLAETYGRRPPASRYTCDTSKSLKGIWLEGAKNGENGVEHATK